MKKILIVMMSAIMLIAMSAFVACSDAGGVDPTHTHSGGTATCTEKAKCDECGEEYGELNPENHASAEFVYVSNGNGTHKKSHKCCNVVTEAAEDCAGGEATCLQKAKCKSCGGEYGELGSHTGGTPTCKEKAVCSDCGQEYGDIDKTNHASEETVFVSVGNGKHNEVHKCCNAVVRENLTCEGGEATCLQKAKCKLCGAEYGEYGAHKGGKATCLEKAECEVCHEKYGEVDPKNHASKEEFVYTANNDGTHKKAYKCCNAVAEANEACSGGTATCQLKAVCKLCGVSYGSTDMTNHADEAYSFVDNGDGTHSMEYNVCHTKNNRQTHSGGNPTCQAKAKCGICGAEYGEYGAHTFTKVGKDSSSHWNECSLCDERDENSVTAHSATVWETTESGEIGKCECGEVITTIVENVLANEMTLYTIASFGGENYNVEEAYEPVVTINGSKINVNVTSDNCNTAIYEDGRIKAVKAGTAIITVSYTLPSNRGTVTKTFDVTVIRPVITDETAVTYFSAIDGWHEYLTELFGDDTITEAKQTYKGEDHTLTFADGKLGGMFTESKTSTVCSLTLCTDTYGYVLSNVTAYTKVINTADDLEDIRLTADRKTVTGYFIMNADIDYSKIDFNGDKQYTYYDNLYPYFNPTAKAPTDMLTEDVANSDNTPNKAAGFVGVFDGNGHKIIGYRAGNSYGFFGTISGSSLSDLTVIKNVAFTDITAEASSWTIGRVFAHYATCVSVENVYISFAKGIESWTKNFSLFGAKESVYFRFNKVVIEYPATSASAAAAGETACVGFFSTVDTTAYYGRTAPDNQWHGQMRTVYQNLYVVAPKATNGRVHALNMSNQIVVYAANDFVDFAEASKVSLDGTTLNPVVNDSGTIEVFHWKNAYRYDTLADMAEAGNTQIGNWSVSASGVVWNA